VQFLNDAQRSRGPDHQVIVELAPFVLANTRLAIQDPTPAANQPIEDPDGLVTAVFNGEIYNYRELERDHRLAMRTACDTETIPLLWSRFGPRCLRLLRGMYGLALVDHQRRRLYLARDPFGMKPLYWRRYRDGLLFASDVAALWRLDRSLPLDPAALGHFLRFGAVAADGSPYRGVHALAPGQCVSVGLDGEVRPELALPALGEGSPWAGDAPASGPALADAFRSSVRLHLRADVPTALLLSAGVDSTMIALAARNQGVPLHCLTVTAPWDADESPQARATAAQYEHSHDAVGTELTEPMLDEFLTVMPRPTIDGLNTYIVSRAVQMAGYKVALSGLGGDEALGGYGYTHWAPALRVLRVADRLPGDAVPRLARLAARTGRMSASNKVERLLSVGGPRTLADVVELQRELFPAATARSLLGRVVDAAARHPVGARAPASVAQAEARFYLQPMLLHDADAFSMASSVELRMPFVDGQFFSTALRRRHLRGKPELVRHMGDRYLRLLTRRHKTGFAVPMHEWMRHGPLRSVIEAARRPDAPVWEHLDPGVGQPILARAATNPRWCEAWSLAVLDGWLRRR
jgi:asparagine synthase (glutamine-hydrolysing)